MLQLKNRDAGPPDFFRFTDPDTGWVTKAVDYYTWTTKAAEHRKANGLPPLSPEAMEAQLCETIGPQWCEHSTGEQSSRSWVNVRLHWRHIVEGTKAYVALIASGFQTVSQEEANRRARICSSCYLKITPQGCGACLKVAHLITGDIAQKKTPYEDQLVNQACGACQCPVSSIVHFPMSALDKADSLEKQNAYTDFCWRKRGGPNRIEEAS